MSPARTAYICTNSVTHVRFLPTHAAHRFIYPTVYFLLSLSALEKGEADLAGGWLFGYNGVSYRVTGMRPSAYLQPQAGNGPNNKLSIKEKLLALLVSQGFDPLQFEDAWMLTMPSYLGFEGINPLTVYFCYRRDHTLWLIALEVHNTFGERHAYILPLGKEYQDTESELGYSHSWTFPRQFHVSPFNDRSGFYKYSLTPPSHPPPPQTERCQVGPESFSAPSMRIDLLVSEPGQLAKPSSKKLFAALRPTSCQPLMTLTLLHVLARHPLSLFLSFARIAYEAAILHYAKGLDVYARPAPVAANNFVERSLFPSINPIQKDAGNSKGRGEGIGWQPEGALERYTRQLAEDFLSAKALELNIRIQLSFADPGFEKRTFNSANEACKKLDIFVRSPQAFVFMFISPSAELALALGCDSERQFSVSDDAVFLHVFGAQFTAPKSAVAWLLQGIRMAFLPDSLTASRSAMPEVNALDHSLGTRQGWTALVALLYFYYLFYTEMFVFRVIRARFIAGDEPWGIWDRLEKTSLHRSTSRA